MKIATSNLVFVVLCLTAVFYSCNNDFQKESDWRLVDVSPIPDSLKLEKEFADTIYNFHLIYCYSGLGANFGKMGQYFEIKDSQFVFCLKQTSGWKDQKNKPDDTLQTGVIKQQTIDAILKLVENKDSLITKRNFKVSSGGLITITVEQGDKRNVLQLHNAYDETAEKIVELLNTYITGDKYLFVYDFPAVDYSEEEIVKKFLQQE